MRDLLSPQAVAAPLQATTKKEVLQEMGRLAADIIGQDPMEIFNVLWERERLGTTGVGHGIAIPHGRLEKLDHVQGFFARLEQPIAFESIDDRPVDLVFLLLAPDSAGADHLHALATVSRLLRDQKLCKQLRAAKDAAAIFHLLTETQDIKVA